MSYLEKLLASFTEKVNVEVILLRKGEGKVFFENGVRVDHVEEKNWENNTSQKMLALTNTKIFFLKKNGRFTREEELFIESACYLIQKYFT